MQFPKRRVFYFLDYGMMEKVHKPSNYMCYTPWILDLLTSAIANSTFYRSPQHTPSLFQAAVSLLVVAW
jgi:hypothetical protein